MSSAESDVLTVSITGAAGRITYSLIPLICSGAVFGAEKRIKLRLIDLEVAAKKLEGLSLEIQDSCYENLDECIVTTNPQVAFQGADVVVLLGSFPRLPGMERRDLISKNAEGIRSQAEALGRFARPDVKVLVVANPANTNCLVAMQCASTIPARNFTCLTRLDQERLRGFVVKKVNALQGWKLPPSAVRNVTILGNHSATQVPYLNECTIRQPDGRSAPLTQLWPTLFSDRNEFTQLTKKLQSRGAEVLNALGASSALSAAEAVAKHLQSWLGPIPGEDTDSDTVFSMGVLSNGNTLGVPDQLVFSFPCRRSRGATSAAGSYEIVPVKTLDTHTTSLLAATKEELMSERSEVVALLGPISIP